MFTKISPTADSQLSNEDVANLMVNDALKNISQLTGLNQEQAFALLVNQVSHTKRSKVHPPLLEQNEAQFISSLFN